MDAYVLLFFPPAYFLRSFEADFTRHPDALNSNVKLVRYQHNPAPNWGPATKASKRKSKETSGEDVTID